MQNDRQNNKQSPETNPAARALPVEREMSNPSLTERGLKTEEAGK